MGLKIKIFLFHRVSPGRDPLWNPMSPKLFEQIIAHLNKNYEIVPLEKTLFGEYKPIGKKELCAITFDDGYKDFIEYAFSILHKFKAPSSLYVISDCVDTNLPPWTYIVNHLFINTSYLLIDLKSKALPPQLQKTNWKNSTERIAYAKQLSPFLKQLNNFERQLIYKQIKDEFNDVDPPLNMMMNWVEIKNVYENGCEIGSHSVSHPLLVKKTNPEEIRKELLESGKKIQEVIGKFPLSISYPFGSYNDEIKKMALAAGYKTGLVVNNRSYNSTVNDVFEIPRIELYDEPFIKAKLRINGTIEKINRIIKPKSNT